MAADRTCSVAGCSKPHHSHGMCSVHVMRWKRGGAVDGPPITVPDRFWAKVDKTDTCWLWTGATAGGYGRFRVGQQPPVQAHRFAYEMLVGPIPEGLQLDHLCRNPRCVRAPDHLEPVTQLVNLRRGVHATKTHCKHGHPYDEANTHINTAGARVCLSCRRLRDRARRARAA